MAEPPRKRKLRIAADAADAASPQRRAPTTAKGEREAYQSFVGTVRNRKGDLVEETSVYGTGGDVSSIEQTSTDGRTKTRKRLGSSSKNPTPENVYNRSAKLLNRQERAFELSVIEGMSVPQIARTLGVSEFTVRSDIRAEEVIRIAESEETRSAEQVRQLILVQDVINEARASRNRPGTGAFSAMTKGIEMRAKLLGLDAPTKVELGVSQLLEAISILPEDIQENVFRKLVSPSALMPAVSSERDLTPVETSNEGIIEGEIVQSSEANVESLSELLHEAAAAADEATAAEPIDTIASDNVTPSVSAAQREAAARAEAVRAAMGTPDGYVIPRAHRGAVRPTAPSPILLVADETGDAGDAILGQVKAHAEASREKARKRQAEANAQLRPGRDSNEPASLADDSEARKRIVTIDAAIPVMSDPEFYKLPPSEQAARVRAARAGTRT